jgi:hypothetical protein
MESVTSSGKDDTPRSRVHSTTPTVDKSRPPMMAVPPPPRQPPPSSTMLPPAFIPERRDVPPPRPSSPPPADLIQRATTPLGSVLSVPGGRHSYFGRQHGSSMPPSQQGLRQPPSTSSFRSAVNAAAYAHQALSRSGQSLVTVWFIAYSIAFHYRSQLGISSLFDVIGSSCLRESLPDFGKCPRHTRQRCRNRPVCSRRSRWLNGSDHYSRYHADDDRRVSFTNILDELLARVTESGDTGGSSGCILILRHFTGVRQILDHQMCPSPVPRAVCFHHCMFSMSHLFISFI